MKAVYIGKDYKSFKNGATYNISTKCELITGNGMTTPTPCLCVHDKNSDAWCPYSRLETMLQNWKLL